MSESSGAEGEESGALVAPAAFVRCEAPAARLPSRRANRRRDAPVLDHNRDARSQYATSAVLNRAKGNPMNRFDDPGLRVGLLGQRGHGKTTLVRALDSMRALITEGEPPHPERSPGLPWVPRSALDTLYVWSIPFCRLDLVCFDPKRHRDAIHALISGNARLDVALLVVAADEGLTSETREQLRLACWLGVEQVVVFLNKIDLVTDPGMLDLAEYEVRCLLAAHGYCADRVPVIRGSVTQALEEGEPDNPPASLGELLAALAACRVEAPASRELPCRLRLLGVGRGSQEVVQVFAEHHQGRLAPGLVLEVLGGSDPADRVVVEGLGPVLSRGRLGGEVLSLGISGVLRTALAERVALVTPDTIGLRDECEAVVYLFTPQEGGWYTGVHTDACPSLAMRVEFQLGEANARLEAFADVEKWQPGEVVRVVCRLPRDQPLPFEVGSRFLFGDRDQPIGCGAVTRLLGPALTRG
jgi:elongation factor Tu